MGPKFDPTAITIGKNILTKKSLVIYPPPPNPKRISKHDQVSFVDCGMVF